MVHTCQLWPNTGGRLQRLPERDLPPPIRASIHLEYDLAPKNTRARPLLVGTRKGRKYRNFYELVVNSSHLKEFLVPIHRVDQTYVLEFSTFQQCQLIRDVLYTRVNFGPKQVHVFNAFQSATCPLLSCRVFNLNTIWQRNRLDHTNNVKHVYQ